MLREVLGKLNMLLLLIFYKSPTILPVSGKLLLRMHMLLHLISVEKFLVNHHFWSPMHGGITILILVLTRLGRVFS